MRNEHHAGRTRENKTQDQEKIGRNFAPLLEKPSEEPPRRSKGGRKER